MRSVFDEINLSPDFSSLFLLITNRCNIECKHCYVESSPQGNLGMSYDLIRQTIKSTIDKNPLVGITLSGGEPLTRKKDVYQILNEFSGTQKFQLLSNGMLISESVAKELSSYPNLRIRLSVDGPTAKEHDFMRGKGSFIRLLRGIENLRKANFDFKNIQISATIPNGNEDSIVKILKFARQTEIEYVKFEPVAKTGNALKNWSDIPEGKTDPDSILFKSTIEAIKKEIQPYWEWEKIHDTGFSEITIYSNGDVYPFTFVNEVDKKFGWVGNIHETPITEILASKKMSDAILEKFLHFSIGPHRSLGAHMFKKSQNGNLT